MMCGSSSCAPKFDQILNFRDVSSVRSPSAASILKHGFLYRSARPDGATEHDRTQLTTQYRIRTIIDLRSKTEHINAAKKHSDAAVALAQPAMVPSSNSTIATPLKVPGIHYAEISLTGKSFERALLWKMSWGQIGKLTGLMAMGYRNEGISVLGKNVMQPRGLVGLGMDTLSYSGKEIKEVFDILADETAYPILVHCTQGKDRTGLIVLLVLLLCGVDVASISNDYVKSEAELQPEMEERLGEIASIGLDASFAGCPPDFVDRIATCIDKRYGGIESYLSGVGVSIEQQQKIRAVLK